MLSFYITDFQIRMRYGSTESHEIDNLSILADVISAESLEEINKVSFYFEDPSHEFHNLILRRDHETGEFHPEFMEDLTEAEKRQDMELVMRAINSTGNLDDQFGKYVVNPYLSDINT